MANRDTAKGWFLTGDEPTQEQFSNLFDYIRFLEDAIAMADVEGLTDAMGLKADATALAALAPIILAAGTATYNAPAGFELSKIKMFDAANPAAVSVGITNGGQEVYEAQDMANKFASFSGDNYFENATTLYFNNITPTTIIKIYK